MLVDANGFVFDNKTSDEFGLIICTIEGNEPSDSSGGQIEFQTTSSPIHFPRRASTKFTSAV